MPCQGFTYSYSGRDGYRKRFEEAERELCEARWLILELASRIGCPQDLEPLVGKHRKAQLRHRLDDRDSVLEQIDDALEDLDGRKRRIVRLGGNPSNVLYERVRRLKEERARIAAMDADALLGSYWGGEDRLDHSLFEFDE